jgi:hypothetical protein
MVLDMITTHDLVSKTPGLHRRGYQSSPGDRQGTRLLGYGPGYLAKQTATRVHPAITTYEIFMF